MEGISGGFKLGEFDAFAFGVGAGVGLFTGFKVGMLEGATKFVVGSPVGCFAGFNVEELGTLGSGVGVYVGLCTDFQVGDLDAFGFVVGAQLGGFTGLLVGECVAFAVVVVGATVLRITGFNVGEGGPLNFVVGA